MTLAAMVVQSKLLKPSFDHGRLIFTDCLPIFGGETPELFDSKVGNLRLSVARQPLRTISDIVVTVHRRLAEVQQTLKKCAFPFVLQRAHGLAGSFVCPHPTRHPPATLPTHFCLSLISCA